MKILTSRKINAFGGLNFVHKELKTLDMEDHLRAFLPILPPQSYYNWNDIFSTLLSIYYCNGDCIEDAKTILRDHFGSNPFFKLCSPDTLLKRMKSLQSENKSCRTRRGSVEHSYNHNHLLASLNAKILAALGVFGQRKIVLDYDNTIIFGEKADCSMTYKRDYGYQPGVCIINENNILFVENRTGNSDAKSFQHHTLQRMFDHLAPYSLNKQLLFRADAASYQYDVIRTLEHNACTFYIGARNSYVEALFPAVDKWIKVENENEWIGEIRYVPFKQRYKAGEQAIPYRLLIKKKHNKTGQLNIVTGDAYEYRAILTNDFDTDLPSAIKFYQRRGNAEKQFDIQKNDFGWSNLPFSKLAENTVFMYFTAICRNLFNVIITRFSTRYKHIKPNTRMKRFVFAFITKPALWVRRSRQWYLRVYGEIQLQI